MNPSESIISMSRSTSRSACGASLVNETHAIPWVQTMVAAREAQAQRAVTTAVPAGLRMEDAAEGVTAPDADEPEEDEEAEASAEGVAAAQAAPRVAMPVTPDLDPRHRHRPHWRQSEMEEDEGLGPPSGGDEDSRKQETRVMSVGLFLLPML